MRARGGILLQVEPGKQRPDLPPSDGEIGGFGGPTGTAGEGEDVSEPPPDAAGVGERKPGERVTMVPTSADLPVPMAPPVRPGGEPTRPFRAEGWPCEDDFIAQGTGEASSDEIGIEYPLGPAGRRAAFMAATGLRGGGFMTLLYPIATARAHFEAAVVATTICGRNLGRVDCVNAAYLQRAWQDNASNVKRTRTAWVAVAIVRRSEKWKCVK